MAYGFKIQRRVEFSETDMAGIVHFSNFFRYMESVEHAFFRSLGLRIAHRDEHSVGWPRVHADCDYRRPLRFEDTFEVELLVREKRERSMVYAIIVRKTNVEPFEEVARGSLIAACVRRDPATGGMMAVSIPAEIANLIEAAPPELLVSGRP